MQGWIQDFAEGGGGSDVKVYVGIVLDEGYDNYWRKAVSKNYFPAQSGW